MKDWWPRVADGLIAVAVLVTGLAEIWVPFESRLGDGDPWVSSVQVAVVSAVLLVRRTAPLLCAAGIFASFTGLLALDAVYLLFYGQFVALVLSCFAVARYGRGREPYVGGALIAMSIVVADLAVPDLQDASELIFHWSVLLVAYSLGTWQRVMAVREVRARERAVAAEVAATEAVLEERTRIARELHDVVAHAMSVIAVQAGATELVADEPDEVRRALGSIRTTASDALAEMRRLVTMLRDPDEPAMREPQPGLDAVAALVSDAQDNGLPVTLELIGAPRDLPAGTDLAAYRIVQEALTNARRHATGLSKVTVTVDFTGAELRLDVRDDGIGSPGTAGSGHGLVGMRERVNLYRGSLRAEPLAGRGFVVEAVLPLEPA